MGHSVGTYNGNGLFVSHLASWRFPIALSKLPGYASYHFMLREHVRFIRPNNPTAAFHTKRVLGLHNGSYTKVFQTDGKTLTFLRAVVSCRSWCFVCMEWMVVNLVNLDA